MIKIICVVDSFKHYDKAIKEFEKRLGKQVKMIKLKPSKKNNINEIIIEESKNIKKELEKTKGYKVLLDIFGEQLDTIEFLKFIEDKEQNYADIIFIIAGAYGLDYEYIKNDIDFRFSLSKMTFPHIEAILIILEQIYRSFSIKKGTSYHH